jgi:hypothetical protein
MIIKRASGDNVDVDTLTGGGGPIEDPEETDPNKLADLIGRSSCNPHAAPTSSGVERDENVRFAPGNWDRS